MPPLPDSPVPDDDAPLLPDDLTAEERALADAGTDLRTLARRRTTGSLVARHRDLATCGIAGLLAGFDMTGTADLLAEPVLEPLHGAVIGVDELLDVLVPRLVAVWAAERLAPLGFTLQLLTDTARPGSPLATVPERIRGVAAALVGDVLFVAAAGAATFGFGEDTLAALGLDVDDPAGLSLAEEFLAECGTDSPVEHRADLLSWWAEQEEFGVAEVAHAALLIASWADLRLAG